MAIVFNSSPRPTIGVEVELQIIDAETRELADGGPAIIQHCNSSHVKPELLQCTVEINTDVCETIADVREDLTTKIREVSKCAENLGYRLLSAGTHPLADWPDQTITEDKRYYDLVDRVQWPAKRLMIFGLHVHVGIDSREKAIAIFNALTTYIPHFLSVSANSPFWVKSDTGLASARVKVFESLPTAGLPYRLINWGEFQQFMNSLINAGAIDSIREVWWDIRPHPGFGTVELRICDNPSTISEIVALTAFVQAVVVWLSKLYDNGISPPILRHWMVRENKWRAARWGTEARIIVDDKGTTKLLIDEIRELIQTVEPFAKELGSHNELMYLNEMLRNPAPYVRQREIYKKTGDFIQVIDALVEELKTDKPTVLD